MTVDSVKSVAAGTPTQIRLHKHAVKAAVAISLDSTVAADAGLAPGLWYGRVAG
ncbi:MAG: hypothetical protein Tsb0019_00140 [Roseibium sp.]